MTSTPPSLRITPAAPRDSARVIMSTGEILDAPVGTSIGDYLLVDMARNPQGYDSPPMGGIFNGKLRELAYPIEHDGRLEPVLLSSSDGGRIYRRSLVLLLSVAVAELWDGCDVSVRYAVPDGGFYCRILGRSAIDDADLVLLAERMRSIVAANVPITKQIVTLDEARDLFRQGGNYDKVRLLEQRTRDDLVLYTLRERTDYYFGYMLPATGYLQYFRLLNADGGFILQYPRKEHLTQLQEISAFKKLTTVFQQADEWLRRLGVEDIGRLNRVVGRNRVQELILVAEALHEQNVAKIASAIQQRYAQGARIVMIAGPSSAGKTTFSKRLAIQLMAGGLRPFTLELDNYFVDREFTPRDESGDYDFEALEAINLTLFNDHLLRLINSEEVALPHFDFITGRSLAGRHVRLHAGQIILIEGIHGLNPALVAQLPPDTIFRVYVSALTQLNIDLHNRIPTTDVRLLRRIARDAQHRGYSAADTIQRWASVRRGEKRNIFPYQENADIIFDSALAYELAALRPLAEPLLLQVEQGTAEHIEANRMLSLLRWVQPLNARQIAMIPDTSLLREFIGGSILHDYHPADFHTDLDTN